ncbi:uncharacterized protein METZ01_LOCUS383057, partial [marine metagenome]
IEDLQQLAIFAGQYDSLNKLLEELLLLGELYGQEVGSNRQTNDDEPPIVLSTVHQAKGLEWHSVFIICLLEGFFPSQRSLDEPGGEEEERRIFYVATTRSREELYLSYPIIRAGGYGASVVQQPSRFLQELPETLYETWHLEEEPNGATNRNGGASQDFDPNIDPIWDDNEPLGEPWLTD